MRHSGDGQWQELGLLQVRKLSGLDYVDRDSGVHKSGLSLLSEELRHSKGFSQTS